VRRRGRCRDGQRLGAAGAGSRSRGGGARLAGPMALNRAGSLLQKRVGSSAWMTLECGVGFVPRDEADVDVGLHDAHEHVGQIGGWEGVRSRNSGHSTAGLALRGDPSCQHGQSCVSPFPTPPSDCSSTRSSIGTSWMRRRLSISTPSCSQPAGRHFDPTFPCAVNVKPRLTGQVAT
jgi:hypothetical protein